MRIFSFGERITGFLAPFCAGNDDDDDGSNGNPWLVLLLKWDSVFDEYKNPGTREWRDWSEGAIETWQESFFLCFCVTMFMSIVNRNGKIECCCLRWATEWEGLWLERVCEGWKWSRKNVNHVSVMLSCPLFSQSSYTEAISVSFWLCNLSIFHAPLSFFTIII